MLIITILMQGSSPAGILSLAAPNFFILGAGKCGTTSLYHALKQHPQVHLSAVKEPSFFSRGFQVVKNPIDYFHLFPQKEGVKRYGEASHVYFSNPETAPVLRQLFPDARFILIVRNPVRRAYSLYQHMRRHEHETAISFGQALSLEEARFHDAIFRENCPQYFWNYMYCRSSLYDEQLGRYLNYFPVGHFLMLTLGEWIQSPTYWAQEIFRFLGVNVDVPVDTLPMNQAEPYPPLETNLEVALEAKFVGLQERLENLIGRKLHYWDA